MPEFRHFGGLKPVCQSSVRPSNVIHHSSSRAQQRNSGGGGIVTVRVALPPGRPVRPSAVDSTTNKYDQVHQPPASLLRFREGGHRPRRQDLRSWYVVGLCDVGILMQIRHNLCLFLSSPLSLLLCRPCCSFLYMHWLILLTICVPSIYRGVSCVIC